MDANEGERTYPLTYDISPEHPPMPRSKCEELGRAAADAVLIVSLIFPKTGGVSYDFVSLDGRFDAPLCDVEMFKVWTMLALDLAKSTELTFEQNDILRTTFERIRTMILRGRSMGDA